MLGNSPPPHLQSHIPSTTDDVPAGCPPLGEEFAKRNQNRSVIRRPDLPAPFSPGGEMEYNSSTTPSRNSGGFHLNARLPKVPPCQNARRCRDAPHDMAKQWKDNRAVEGRSETHPADEGTSTDPRRRPRAYPDEETENRCRPQITRSKSTWRKTYSQREHEDEVENWGDGFRKWSRRDFKTGIDQNHFRKISACILQFHRYTNLFHIPETLPLPTKTTPIINEKTSPTVPPHITHDIGKPFHHPSTALRRDHLDARFRILSGERVAFPIRERE